MVAVVTCGAYGGVHSGALGTGSGGATVAVADVLHAFGADESESRSGAANASFCVVGCARCSGSGYTVGAGANIFVADDAVEMVGGVAGSADFGVVGGAVGI